MRKVFLTLLLLFSVAIKAQNNLPPPFEITADTTVYDIIPSAYWQLLRDNDARWTIQQVNTSPLATQFQQGAPLPFNTLTHAYWFRFRLRNGMDKDAKVGFWGGNEKTEFYLQYPDGTWQHKVTGWLVPWSKKDGLKRIQFIPIVIKPHEEVLVYKRVYNSFHFPVISNFTNGFGYSDKVVQQMYIDDETNHFSAIHNSYDLGFLFFAALISLFFFFIVWERVYLYFALYVFFLGGGRFENELYNFAFREHPIIAAFLLTYGFWMLTIFFQTQFIRHLLKTYNFIPHLDKFLRLLNFLPIVVINSLYFMPPLSTEGAKVFIGILFLGQVSVVLTALLAFFLALQKQNWPNKVLSFAIFPAFCMWGLLWSTDRVLTLLIIFLGLIPQTLFSEWLFKWWYMIETVCLGWQVVFFSWLLLHRFSEQRKQITQLALQKEQERSQLIERQKQDLEQQVTARTSELKQSLEDLKSTQTQLIQSEKMASLGELTAGIAHEIQNPLNFVNNFSETNVELIEEAQTELEAGNQEMTVSILNTIKDNESKIHHHGRRADAIVKNMLQHSRTSSGQKEPTDLNKLVDEYLRLSYHGLRAKDKSFNAKIETHLDNSIGKINIVSQEIGRVLLNLFNNAFYAVHEKKKKLGEDNEPTVSVNTKKLSDKVEISVQDNGMGISKSLVDKIFQPFFTTKPTGEGTGLGLSLSYDIIKAHGGDITVDSSEGEGAAFIIQLPLSY